VDTINVAVRRGAIVEARHRVHAVVVRDGDIVEARGDPELVTFLRSAAKPLQALPVAETFPELTPEEIAIACASHEALPAQLEAVRSLLARAGAREEDLECGEERGGRLGHNCSGKHAGMLLLCRGRGWEPGDYRLPEHPLQRELLALVARATDTKPERIATAVDGCGVPTFAVSLLAMARAFARLMGRELPGAERVVAAVTAHPELVGGPDSVDTLVMRALPGAIAKRGAEGVLCAALPDGAGVALKVEDGAQRAVFAATGRLLGIGELAERPVANSRGEDVGSIAAE
jgi:L-asparaginase II